MVSTVTTTTAAAVATSPVASLVIIAVLALILLLILKDIASGLASARALQFSRALDTAIVPLITVFVATVIVEVIEFLQ